MSINTRLSSLLVVLVAAGVVHAQAPAAKPAPKAPDAPAVYFNTMDKNADRSLSREEALVMAELASAFEMLDSDRDETLSPSEFSRWSRAGKVTGARPEDPATAPGGSAGAQHMPGMR